MPTPKRPYHKPGTCWWQALHHDLPTELKHLRVGIYGSGGAPYHHAALVALWGMTPLCIRAEDIHQGILERLDVLIFPGGGLSAMTGMLTPLGTGGAEAVRTWVAAGGMYLGSCAGSFLPVSVGEAYWKAHEEARQLHMVDAPLANGSDSAFEGLTSPGVGTIEVALTDPHHWLVEGLPERFELVHYNGPLFDLEAQSPHDLPSGRAAAKPDGVLRPVAATPGFTPSEAFLKPLPKDATLFERCLNQGAHNGIVAHYGEGLVVLCGSHPEFGFNAVQLGWGPGVRLLANAVTYQAKRRHSTKSPSCQSPASPDSAKAATLARTLQEIGRSFNRTARHLQQLRDAPTGSWLEPRHAPAFLGRSAPQLWRDALSEAETAAQVSETLVTRLQAQPDKLISAAQWIDDPPRVNQDVGFMGLKQLVERAESSLLRAHERLTDDPITLAHAYDGLDKHPYQIAASSYLSAAGLTAAALLSATVVAILVGHPEAVPLDMLVHTQPAPTTNEQGANDVHHR